MRNILYVLAIGALCLALAVGAHVSINQAVEPNAPEQIFELDILNDSGAPIYALHIEYYLGDEPVGGMVTQYADGSPIRPGDVFDAGFTAAEFPAGADISGLRVEIFAVTEAGRELSLGAPVEIDAERGGSAAIAVRRGESGQLYLELAD